jgi:hypothetical protein
VRWRALRRDRDRPDQVRRQAHRRVDRRAWCARPPCARSTTPSSTWRDIDAVVIGKAPDMFEGVMMPGAVPGRRARRAGKPLLRVHTAGSVGGSTAIVAASLVQAGIHERVLTVAFEKQSESNAMWALDGVAAVLQSAVVAGAGGYFAPLDPRLHAALRRARGHRHPMVAVKDRATRSRTRTRTCRSRTSRLDDAIAELADAVGPDPLPRDLPVVGRRLRDGARQRGSLAGARRASRPGCSAPRCAASRSSPAARR